MSRHEPDLLAVVNEEWRLELFLSLAVQLSVRELRKTDHPNVIILWLGTISRYGCGCIAGRDACRLHIIAVLHGVIMYPRALTCSAGATVACALVPGQWVTPSTLVQASLLFGTGKFFL